MANRYSKFGRLFLLLLLVFSVNTAFGEDETKIEINKLTDSLYKLTLDKGGFIINTVASIGDDGILLVDSGYKDDGKSLKKKLAEFGKGDPKIIINTHAHRDHTEGNTNFANETLIIGHEKLRKSLSSGVYLFSEYKKNALPDIGFKDTASLFFNGEEIKLIALPGAHDETDIIVYFTKSKIVCMGDIAYKEAYPSIDEFTGDVLKYPDVVKRAIKLLPKDITIVAGHTDNMTIDDLKIYGETLQQTIAAIQNELSKGKDLATIQKEKALEKWESFRKAGYVSTDSWIETIVYDLQNYWEKEKQETITLFYNEYNKNGLKSALKLYDTLKQNDNDTYRFTNFDLSIFAKYADDKNNTAEAIKLMQRQLKEYPESDYRYYDLFEMGTYLNKTGKKAQAIMRLEQALQLKPKFEPAKKLLDEIKNDHDD